jgi:PilZ domain
MLFSASVLLCSEQKQNSITQTQERSIWREDPVSEPGEAKQKRRHQRIQLEVEVIVRTDSELLPGRTHDISESGVSAILPVELGEGQEVELQIRFPKAAANTRAIVRHRNVNRHGFEFEQPLHQIFRSLVIADGLEDTLTYFDLSRAIFRPD